SELQSAKKMSGLEDRLRIIHGSSVALVLTIRLGRLPFTILLFELFNLYKDKERSKPSLQYFKWAKQRRTY
ncbi:hypothetical protein P4479_26375, partial [Brevibacillus agri]|uniref:hypothetical protein n=1 Tax=Brevibacillus agri TaxID=51101 RepID=UPI002E1A3EA4|nr:hypothetical protein [Brevibacillus agri]